MKAFSEGERVYDVKKYYEKYESSNSLYGSYSMEKWILRTSIRF